MSNFKFNLFAESILTEAKIDDAIKKAGLDEFDSHVAKAEFQAIGSKAGYIDWMLKDRKFMKPDFAKAVKEFEQRKGSLAKKDINAYGSLDELKEALAALGLSRSEKKDAPVLFEDDKFTVRLIKTHEAAMVYGQGTGTGDKDAWCITVPGQDGKDNFNEYTRTGPFTNPCYYIISKKTPLEEKFCIIPSVATFRRDNAFQDNANVMLKEQEMKRAIGTSLYDKIREHSRKWFKDLNVDVDLLLDMSCGKGNWTRRADGKIDSSSDLVAITEVHVQDGKIADGIRFGKVRGDFRCSRAGLTTLEGCPEEVDRDFFCIRNSLSTLEGGPTKVGQNYFCGMNGLTSLKGCPENIVKSFSCPGNNLETLEGGPLTIGNDFSCAGNKLSSLKGGPTEVGGEYDCSGNQLTSLEGAPLKLNFRMNCKGNKLMKSQAYGFMKGRIDLGNLQL